MTILKGIFDRFWLGVMTLVIVYSLIAINLISIFPPVNLDEMNGIVSALSFVQGKMYQNFLFNDIGTPQVDPMFYMTASVGRPLYVSWFGIGLKLLPGGLLYARCVSVITGAALILFLALIGRKWGGRPFGLLCGSITLFLPSFWITSLVVNELILASLFSAFMIWFQSMTLFKKDWMVLLWSALLPQLILIHPYGVLLWLSIGLMGFLMDEMLKFKRTLFLVGSILGLALVLLAEPWVIQFQNPFYAFLSKPPIFTNLSGQEWFDHLKAFFLYCSSFYCPGADQKIWGLKESFFLTWAIVALVLIVFPIIVKANTRFFKLRLALTISLTVLTFGLAVLASRHEGGYQIFLAPFLVPLIAFFIRDIFENLNFRFTFMGVCLFLLSLSSIGTLSIFIQRYISTYVPHQKIVAELKTHVSAESKRIMAPSIFMFDFPGHDFRDVGVLMKLRFYFEGAFQPSSWLRQWSPDIVVIDSSLARVLAKEIHEKKTLSEIFGRDMLYKGSVKTGTVFGDLYIFKSSS